MLCFPKIHRLPLFADVADGLVIEAQGRQKLMMS